MLLDAVEKSGIHLFYKPHMEEAPNRVQMYATRVAERQLLGQVTELGGDAADAVAIADVVATAYSTAALDAAIRKTPVVCVAAGDIRYPIDTPAMAGGAMVRSADELAAYLTEFAHDRSAAQAAAQDWLKAENQFLTGVGPHVRQLVVEAVERGATGVRAIDAMPSSLFTDGPHPSFPV
jgi:hypothetical protein